MISIDVTGSGAESDEGREMERERWRGRVGDPGESAEERKG